MNLTSIERIEKGWKIHYESKAADGIPVTVKYPSFNDIGLGKPTDDFSQAIAPFLRFAIAISHRGMRWRKPRLFEKTGTRHLDPIYWLQNGRVKAIKFKEGKLDQMLCISVEADNNDSLVCTKITTHWVEFFSLMSLLQAGDPGAASLGLAVEELERQVEKYVNGDRATQQLELLPSATANG